MPANADVIPNVKQSVPFFMVTDIEASYRFYVDGVGFTMTHEWRSERAAIRGEMLLEEFLKPLGITQSAFAVRLGYRSPAWTR
jgi:hypothetical protein